MSVRDAKEEALLLAESQLLLAEKRTYYALLRTGLAVFTAAIAFAAFLVAAKDFHPIFEQAWLTIFIFSVLGLFALAGFIVFLKAKQKINNLTALIEKIEKKNKRIAELIL
ncbi:hypothetical protein HYW58_01170 [Candidatus Kaiserbacteria bacterium]|nr:hypothetical protein [Candidatus Kaiserbacteria bacterium]